MIKKVRLGLGATLIGLGMFAEFNWIPMSVVCMLAGYILLKDITMEEENYD